MAVKLFGVNNALTNKLFSRKLAIAAIAGTYIDKFTGSDDDSAFQMVNEAHKAPGDQITCGLAVNLTGDGVLGSDPLEGNEESITTYDDALILNELKHAVRVGARSTITQQRVPYDLRQLALKKLSKWWVDKKDKWAANQLGGNTATSGTTNSLDVLGNDIRNTGLQATLAPDANHTIRAGAAATDQALSSDLFSLNLIDIAVERAKTLDPLIRPIMIGGQPFYVCFLHPHQATDLRTAATSTGTWYDIQSRAMDGGEISGNPIFTGALGVYNQTIIHEWSRVPRGVNSSTGAAIDGTRRAIFCGAQAMWIGYGQDHGPSRYKWVEKLWGYDEQLGVSGACIGGAKKSRFNSVDYGLITIPTSAVQHDDS
jgi:N4-gp56 family major capsid protein